MEEANGIISAFEFKWKNSGRKKIPNSFLVTYLVTYSAKGTVIDRENFRNFILTSHDSVK